MKAFLAYGLADRNFVSSLQQEMLKLGIEPAEDAAREGLEKAIRAACAAPSNPPTRDSRGSGNGRQPGQQRLFRGGGRQGAGKAGAGCHAGPSRPGVSQQSRRLRRLRRVAKAAGQCGAVARRRSRGGLIDDSRFLRSPQRIQPLPIDDLQQLPRRAAGLLRALFPGGDGRLADVQPGGQHALAGARLCADAQHVLGGVFRQGGRHSASNSRSVSSSI